LGYCPVLNKAGKSKFIIVIELPKKAFISLYIIYKTPTKRYNHGNNRKRRRKKKVTMIQDANEQLTNRPPMDP
jgi:hypothetical protein